MTAIDDPSTRFLAIGESPLPANLAALWAVSPELAEAVEATETGPDLQVELSRAGEPTLSIRSADGARVHLHSRYDPLAEAQRGVDAIDAKAFVFFHVFGLGLGYPLELLFDRAGDEAVFMVFEPDLRILRAALESRRLARLIETGRVQFVWKLDKSDLFVRLMPYTPMISLGTADLLHAASLRLQPAFHEQMQAWLAEFASFTRTNMNTLLLNGRRTLENIARNVGWYAASPCPSRLGDRFNGKPAVIVSAGPSLRKNKHLLHGLVGRAVIIAVQTTLKPLLEMGIQPDFVTALDYHDICTRFFEKLPASLGTELVAESKATNLIFSLHTGPVSVTGNEMAESLLREMSLNKTGLRSGSTVAHLAYYLAEHLGCNPIAFVGQDLGFSDGLYYTPGTSYEDVWRPELGRFCSVEMKNWEQIVRERPIMRQVPDQQGIPMYTEERLFTYLQQFERDFGQTATTIIDATEGGAAKRGATPMTLADFTERYCAEPLEQNIADHAGADWDRTSDCIASLRLRQSEAAEIARISHATLPLLQTIADHLDDQPCVNQAIADIDQLRTEMNVHGRTYSLVVQLTQETEMKRFTADRKIAATQLSGTDRQREQVLRDLENVKAVAAAATEFQQLMDEVIVQLRSTVADLEAPQPQKVAA